MWGCAVRCVIVDDSAIFLEAACTVLERDGVAVVGVASTSDECLHRVDELRPDVVLVDVNLGEESGFYLAERLQRAQPELSVILISTQAPQEFADLVAASPAIGFLTKSPRPRTYQVDELATAVHPDSHGNWILSDSRRNSSL